MRHDLQVNLVLWFASYLLDSQRWSQKHAALRIRELVYDYREDTLSGWVRHVDMHVGVHYMYFTKLLKKCTLYTMHRLVPNICIMGHTVQCLRHGKLRKKVMDGTTLQPLRSSC